MQEPILAQLASDDPDEVRAAAFEAGYMGLQEAVPLLIRQAESANAGVQEAVDQALRKIRGADTVRLLLPLLNSEDSTVRNLSMDVLREIGNDDLDTLIEQLESPDDDLRIFVSDILGSCHSAFVVPALCEALLNDKEVNVRYQAAVSLGQLAFAQAADCLNKAMKDEEWVQFAVIEALAKIRAESSVGALVQALDASSDLVASMIVDALGEIGNFKAVPLLIKRLDISPRPLCNKIVKAIIRLLGGASLTLLDKRDQERISGYLLAAMTDEDQEIVDAAMKGLASLGGDVATREILGVGAGLDPVRDHDRLEMVAQLLARAGVNETLLDGVRKGPYLEAILCLTAMNTNCDRRCLDTIIAVFEEKERDLRRVMAEVLAAHCTVEDMPFLLGQLDAYADPTVMKSVLYALARLRSAKAVPRVLKLLDHKYPDVREAALRAAISLETPEIAEFFQNEAASADAERKARGIYALGMINAEAHEAVIQAGFSDPSPLVRSAAIEAFSQLEPTPEHLRLLEPLLSDEDRTVRQTVVEKIGASPNVRGVDLLFKALDDEDDWVKLRAVEALGRHRAQPVVLRLLEKFENSGRMVQMKIIEALGDIGGNTAFQAVLSLMDYDDPEIQQAAGDAASRIRDEHGESE